MRQRASGSEISQVARHGEREEHPNSDPYPYWANSEGDRFAADSLPHQPRSPKRQSRQAKDKKRVELKRGSQISVQYLVHGPQPSAARAQQACRAVEQTDRVEPGLRRIEEIQDGRPGQHCRRANRPDDAPIVTSRTRHHRTS